MGLVRLSGQNLVGFVAFGAFWVGSPLVRYLFLARNSFLLSLLQLRGLRPQRRAKPAPKQAKNVFAFAGWGRLLRLS